MSDRRVLPHEWFTAAELAARGLPGLPGSKRGVQMAADREGWAEAADGQGRPLARARKGRGGGVEYHVSLLPEAARLALAAEVSRPAQERPDRDSAWMRFERLAPSLKAEAARRLDVIQEVESFMRAGLGKERALETVVSQARRLAEAKGEAAPFSASTLRSWFARIADVEPSDRLAYLAPDYTGRTVRSDVDRAAFDHFAAEYLRLSKPTISASYRRTLRVAADRGWTVPSEKSLKRRLDAEIPQSVQTFLREGEQALAHAVPHMERTRAGIGALQIINLDGHHWDNQVLWPDGSTGRPWCIAVQDIASGKVLSVRFDGTLNQHLVRLALADVFSEHGLPETVIMDNGRENAARSISGGQSTRWRWKVKPQEPAGLLKSLGIEAVFATPYWGQAKPVERMFRNWADEIARHPAFEGSYTGKDTSSKPANYGQRAIPIAEFEARVREELIHYNAQLGRTGIGMAGRSFDQVYEALAERRPPRRATPEQLRLALLASEPVRMNPRDHSVRVLDHRYGGPELMAIKPQQVVVRFDPENLANPAHIYSLDGRYLCAAPRIRAGNFDDAATAQAHGRDRRKAMRQVKEAAAALVRLSPADVAAALPAPDPAGAKTRKKKDPGNVVRPAFGTPRTADQASPNGFDAAWERGAARLSGGG
ncbi:MAG: transposase domain-containing protein [Caulobacter sp.]